MGRPMPDNLRAALRSRQDPATAVECSHCGAQPGEECHGRTAKTRGRRRDPHPARVGAAPSAVVIQLPVRSPEPAA